LALAGEGAAGVDEAAGDVALVLGVVRVGPRPLSPYEVATGADALPAAGDVAFTGVLLEAALLAGALLAALGAGP